MNSNYRNLVGFFLIFLLLLPIIVSVAFAQFEPPSDPYQEINDYGGDVPAQKDDEYFHVPETMWPKAKIYGIYSAFLVYISLVFGCISFIIGHYAGGRLNKTKIYASIIIATTVAVFSRSFNILLKLTLTNLLTGITDNKILAASIADAIVYVLWMFFISGIAVYIYETFTVTAKEAFQPRA